MIDNLYQSYYSYLSHEWQLSDRAIFCVSVWLVHELVSWSLNGLLFACYHFNLCASQRIRGKQWPSRALVKQAVVNQLVSKTLLGVPGTYAIYPLFGHAVQFAGPVPGLATLAAKSAAAFVILDFLFYWSHRAAHHRSVYKYVHKQHHTFKNVVGIAYAYAHPVEDILINSLPVFVALWLVQFHLAHFMIFLALRISETIDAHSGFDFWWSPWRFISGSPEHWYHHALNNGNYGILHFWDHVCGTDVPYKEWRKKVDDMSAEQGVDLFHMHGTALFDDAELLKKKK